MLRTVEAGVESCTYSRLCLFPTPLSKAGVSEDTWEDIRGRVHPTTHGTTLDKQIYAWFVYTVAVWIIGKGKPLWE